MFRRSGLLPISPFTLFHATGLTQPPYTPLLVVNIKVDITGKCQKLLGGALSMDVGRIHMPTWKSRTLHSISLSAVDHAKMFDSGSEIYLNFYNDVFTNGISHPRK